MINKQKKRILLIAGFSLLFLAWGTSMYLLYLRERGYFIEAQQIRQYQRFIDLNLPEESDLYYRISFLDQPIGYFYSSLESHLEDYYYNKTQEMMIVFSEIAQIPLYLHVEMKSSHNMDGSLMFQNGQIVINDEPIMFHGNVVEKSAIIDIEYRSTMYNREFELPDQYLTLDLLSPLNIQFSEFVLYETYKLDAFFPHMPDFPQSIYLRMEDIKEITVDGRQWEAYHVHIFDENQTLSSHLWVDKNNRILRQTFQEYIEIEMITEEEYLSLSEHFAGHIQRRDWEELPDLSPLLEGRWWKGLTL